MTTIDPSKVKAGDTVTLENGTTTITGQAGTQHSLGDLTAVIIHGAGTLYFRDGWTLTDHQPAPQPEWQPGTVYEITTRDDHTIAAWCITGARSGHVVFLDQDGEEYDPSELLAITPQTSVNFTVAELEAEVERLRSMVDTGGQQLIEDRNRLQAEVERLRAAMESSTHSILAQGWHHEGNCPARTLPTREQVSEAMYPEVPGAVHNGSSGARIDRVMALFEQGGAATTCPHGQTAEELCNRLPDDRTLTAMRLLWDSLTPGAQRTWETRAEASADG